MPSFRFAHLCVLFLLFFGLSVAWKPHVPRQHPPVETVKRTESGVLIGTVSSPTVACDAEFEAIYDALPTEPPNVIPFSVSYYDTHPRTADYPLDECAWMAELPDELGEELLEWDNKTTEWFLGLKPKKDGDVFYDVAEWFECMADSPPDPCEDELATRLLEVEEKLENASGRDMAVAMIAGIPGCLLVAAGVWVLGVS